MRVARGEQEPLEALEEVGAEEVRGARGRAGGLPCVEVHPDCAHDQHVLRVICGGGRRCVAFSANVHCEPICQSVLVWGVELQIKGRECECEGDFEGMRMCRGGEWQEDFRYSLVPLLPAAWVDFVFAARLQISRFLDEAAPSTVGFRQVALLPRSTGHAVQEVVREERLGLALPVLKRGEQRGVGADAFQVGKCTLGSHAQLRLPLGVRVGVGCEEVDEKRRLGI